MLLDDIVKIDSTTSSKSLSSSSNSRTVLSILYTLALVLSRRINSPFTMIGPSVPNQRTILHLLYNPSYLSSFLDFKASLTPHHLYSCVTSHTTPQLICRVSSCDVTYVLTLIGGSQKSHPALPHQVLCGYQFSFLIQINWCVCREVLLRSRGP
eukprot:Blabericola_migrator_1__4881@NODE_2553_length_2616_cov_65_397411_g1595_i0_p1_GENE_NODE_2553_length_2616_cov_65_397411_g1595_i0NODE_2553_length_2616_cov_65_397411_g1595_i0_p1_ORF_typecomplete_len154_score8_66_NODE_2553_length_2616_cov_65_397411_g1595_i07841245